MPNILIRNVPLETLEALRQRAARNNRSVQAEALEALRRSAKPTGAEIVARLKQSRRHNGDGQAGVAAIREDRDAR